MISGTHTGIVNDESAEWWVWSRAQSETKRSLHLFDIVTQTRATLLNFCSYVQWVRPKSVAST